MKDILILLGTNERQDQQRGKFAGRLPAHNIMTL